MAAGAAVLPMVPRIARAQFYTTRPITIIVPYGPGGGTDLAARMLSGPLAATLGQNVIVGQRRQRSERFGLRFGSRQSAVIADPASPACNIE
jgi:hypothetical protein